MNDDGCIHPSKPTSSGYNFIRGRVVRMEERDHGANKREREEGSVLSDKDNHSINNGNLKNGASSESNSKATYTALLLSMSLPSSCYATMALREILRVETDRASLAKNNQYKRPADEDGGTKVKVARTS